MLWLAVYQQMTTKQYNKRLNILGVRVGYLVLREVESSIPLNQEKLMSTSEFPYEVFKVV